MTIPADNWCSACQEPCHDHSTICTVCGTTLGPPPTTATTTSSNNRSSSSSSSFTGVRAVPEFMTDDVRHASLELRNMLTGLRGQVQNLDALSREAIGNTTNNNEDDEWQNAPAEALEPQGPSTSRGRPTAKETLKKIPRIVLDDKSSLFRQATLELSSSDMNTGSTPTPLHYQTVPGEFGSTSATKIPKSTLILASPRTGKGGLSEETKAKIRQTTSNPVIVYMERGDGITFVQKAIMAQELGALAVIIGNNMPTPWPYVMKDSKGEADQLRLTIPVTMVKQSDGKKIVEYCCADPDDAAHSNTAAIDAQLNMQSLSRDCVVCCETFGTSQTVLQLPACGHVFHEKCAMIWLQKQNTCPYCRRELPTDDPEYEAERRRVQRTHAGSSSNRNESGGWNDFYG